MFQNLGELGESLQELVTRFKTRTHTTRNVQTLDDIKRFVAEYPEFKVGGGCWVGLGWFGLTCVCVCVCARARLWRERRHH